MGWATGFEVDERNKKTEQAPKAVQLLTIWQLHDDRGLGHYKLQAYETAHRNDHPKNLLKTPSDVKPIFSSEEVSFLDMI